MSIDFNVTLYRDSLTTPWGFRLEGGKDYQHPLAVQRVFTGSPASVDLHAGDLIRAIQNRDASPMLHKEADDFIRSAGGSLTLLIRRWNNTAVTHSYRQPQRYRTAVTNYNDSYAHLFNANAQDPTHSYIRSRPLDRQKDPNPYLSQSGSPFMPDQFNSTLHGQKTNNKQRFLGTSTQNSLGLPQTNFLPSHQLVGTSPLQQQPHEQQLHGMVQIGPNGGGPSVEQTNHTAQPYTSNMANQLSHSLRRATHQRSHTTSIHPTYYSNSLGSTMNLAMAPSPAHNSRGQGAQLQSPLVSNQRYFDDSHLPSFGSGSGNGGGGGGNPAPVYHAPSSYHNHQQKPSHPHPHDLLLLKLNNNNNNTNRNNQNNLNQQEQSANHPHHPAETPKVKHAQYNSPMGLYSQSNVREELNKQVGGGTQRPADSAF